MPRTPLHLDPHCAVSAATQVLADGWCWRVVLDVARGHHRFDDLVAELGISRKVLADRLEHLVARDVLRRSPYQDNPTRHDYVLTEQGKALLPVLVGLQDWGDRWVLGAGEVTATSTAGADERRVRALVGGRVPEMVLPATSGDGAVADGPTVLFAYPATGRPTPLPAGWSDIPGAAGCTLENRLFRDRYAEFQAAGLAVQGVSTQRAEEQRAFADAERIPFPLLSDMGMELATALRLPTLRVADQTRLRRLVLVVDAERVVRAVRYPVLDLEDAIGWALAQGRKALKRRATGRSAHSRPSGTSQRAARLGTERGR
ncbi:MAG TPA: winged helix-turn-helix transcriptional regulator [Mycobacteriales bacterium]|nr:winged helix-turn-helix transcriptional regulator [Mycobacteriales bacterium]